MFNSPTKAKPVVLLGTPFDGFCLLQHSSISQLYINFHLSKVENSILLGFPKLKEMLKHKKELV